MHALVADYWLHGTSIAVRTVSIRPESFVFTNSPLSNHHSFPPPTTSCRVIEPIRRAKMRLMDLNSIFACMRVRRRERDVRLYMLTINNNSIAILFKNGHPAYAYTGQIHLYRDKKKSAKMHPNIYTTEKLLENLGDDVCVKKSPSMQQQQTRNRAGHLAC